MQCIGMQYFLVGSWQDTTQKDSLKSRVSTRRADSLAEEMMDLRGRFLPGCQITSEEIAKGIPLPELLSSVLMLRSCSWLFVYNEL